MNTVAKRIVFILDIKFGALIDNIDGTIQFIVLNPGILKRFCRKLAEADEL